MDWWIWLVLGLGLLGAEVVTPGGFDLMFFGLGGVAVGLLAAAGLGGPLWAQVGLFAAVSAGSLALFRRRLLEGFKVPHAMEESLADLVGGSVVLTEDAAPHGRGRAEFRGAPWAILNADGTPLSKGQRAKVLGVEGLTLKVTKE